MRVILILLAIATAASTASARPEYARRERKACVYCHINPMGGGARNARGIYYGSHNKSFDGYDEVKIMGTAPTAIKKLGPPVYMSAWKIEMLAGTSRIAVADVDADQRPRLLALGEGQKLTIFDASEKTLKIEETLDLGEKAKRFVAGHFAKGMPAIIAAPGVIYYKDGGRYKKTPVSLDDITGTVRFADGAEFLFYVGGGGQPDVWAIDYGSDKPLLMGREMKNPAEGAGIYNELVARLPAEHMSALGIPADGQKVGVVGFLDPRSDGKWYVWLPLQTAEGSYIVIANDDAIAGGGQAGDMKPVWKSPKLTGKLLDVALGRDPRNPKRQGIFALQATGADGKGRTLEFFAVD